MTDTTNDLTTEEDEFYRKCVFFRKMAKDFQDMADSFHHYADECKCERERSTYREFGNSYLAIRELFIETHSEYLN